MENIRDLEQRVTDIEHSISAMETGSGSGALPITVMTVLTASAIGVLLLGAPPTVVWLVHNVIGWAFILIWWEWTSQKEGRHSLRGRLILRLWAAITLAIWVSVLTAHGNSNILVPLWLAAGMFGTGALLENVFVQLLGILWILTIGILGGIVASIIANILLIASLVIMPAIGATGLYLQKRAAK